VFLYCKLQVFYLDIVYISHTCCKCMFQMFHLLQMYVAFKCFHVASVSCFRVMFRESLGHGPRTVRRGAASADRRMGRAARPGSYERGVLVLILAPVSCPHRERGEVQGKGATGTGPGEADRDGVRVRVWSETRQTGKD
jgi:hypothetical protein